MGLFLIISNGNWGIMTAIDYMTGWPIAKAVKDVRAETVADFLVQKIFMHHAPPKEFLSDNSTNFLVNVVENYLQKLYT